MYLVSMLLPNMMPMLVDNPNEKGMLRRQAVILLAGGAALQDSGEQWSRLASSFEADISQQPALLQGGQLRDYQMKVT